MLFWKLSLSPPQTLSPSVCAKLMAKAAVSLLVPRTQVSSFTTRASMDAKSSSNNNNVSKELGLFSLKRKIEDAVSRAEMTTPLALEVEEAKRIKQEEMLLEYNLWDDLARSNESLSALANAIKVVHELKDLQHKAEEAKLISQLAEMDIVNDQLFKQAYEASLDVSKFLDRYEMSKHLRGPFDKEGVCLIITAGPEGITSEIWAESIMKMYIKWSKKHGCEGRIVEKYPSSGSCIRRATLEFEKEFVYGYLSGEKGVHKMIRSSLDGSVVRETCSADVDVIPLFLDSTLNVHIDDKDMEIASQTSHLDDESAYSKETVVSAHHIPSGVTVQCSGERSYFANEMKALNRLKAKLLVLATEQGVSDLSKIKGDGTADTWNHETRRYMFRPHKSVQDVRTGIHIPDLNSVLSGNIEPLIRAHIAFRQGKDIAS